MHFRPKSPCWLRALGSSARIHLACLLHFTSSRASKQRRQVGSAGCRLLLAANFWLLAAGLWVAAGLLRLRLRLLRPRVRLLRPSPSRTPRASPPWALGSVWALGSWRRCAVRRSRALAGARSTVAPAL
jgi:hypothetical protein